MNPRNTFLLLALAAGLFAFIFFFERHRKEEELRVVHELPGLRPSSVRKMSITSRQSKSEEIPVERTTNGWWLSQPVNYPAETVMVNRLLLELMQLKPQLHLSSRDLKGRNINEEYGFDHPLFTIIIQDDQPQPKVLNLGRLTAPGDQIYAQVVGSEGVDLVSSKLLEFIPHEANEWRDSLLVDLKGIDFDRLTVAGVAGKFELQREGTNQAWRLFKPDVARADNPKILGLLTNLQKLSAVRFQTDATNADLEPFGLKPPVLELGFERGSNHLFSLQFGKSPTNESAVAYAKRDDRPAVALVPLEPLTGWNDSVKLFRDRHLARFNPAEVSLIEIRGQSNAPTVVLRRQIDDSWRVTAPMAFAADTNTMRDFLKRLGGLEAVPNDGNVAVQDIVAESSLPGYGLSPPVRQYILKRAPTGNNSSNSVLAEIDFGSEKDGRVFARRGDLPEERSVYAVNAADFSALPVSWIAFHARSIWNFSPYEVATITIRRDGKPSELTHKGTNEWAITSGSAVMRDLTLTPEVGAEELGTLEAEAWVDRGSENLARYGFTDKSLQFSVKLVAKESPRILTVDFGGTSPRGLRYGAARMEDGQIWIFECPAVVFDRLTSYFNIRE